MLRALFMVSRTTIEREIRFLLRILWTCFRNLIEWPTTEQRMNMANNSEHFPGRVAPVAAINETTLSVIAFIRGE